MDEIKKTEEIKILVVDDEILLLELYVEDLQDEGYQVFSASSGNSAFEIIKKENIDIVISDIRMPDGNGIELLDKIKEYSTGTPVVIFISGFYDILPELAYAKGAEALLNKPVDHETILSVVKKSLLPKNERWARTYERIDINCNIELILPDYTKAINTRIINVGNGGMFIKINNNQLKINEGVKFKFIFEDEKYSPIEGKGVVRWIRKKNTNSLSHGIGIEFLNLSKKTVSNIIFLLDEIKTKSFIPLS